MQNSENIEIGLLTDTEFNTINFRDHRNYTLYDGLLYLLQTV